MKSSLRSDEIFGVPPQMKLNPSSYPDEVGFHHEVISSHDSGIYPVRKDGFSWKKPFAMKYQNSEWNRATHDEILTPFGWNLQPTASDEIKSVPSPREAGFHHEVISSHVSGIYPVRKDGFSWKSTQKRAFSGGAEENRTSPRSIPSVAQPSFAPRLRASHA